jgi:hypothetical protein
MSIFARSPVCDAHLNEGRGPGLTIVSMFLSAMITSWSSG